MHISEQELLISGLIDEIEALLPRLGDMNLAEAEELYKTLNYAAKFSSQNIQFLSNTEPRVKLCDYRDRVLDRIIDEADERRAIEGEVFAPSLFEWGSWNNEQLLKDACLVPYLIAKELDTRAVVFFGDENIDYPYLEHLPEISFITNDSNKEENHRIKMYLQFLADNSSRADILTIYGAYTQCANYLNFYRMLRPDGKVYLTLDMNNHWRVNYPWTEPMCVTFFSQCNMITNSCRVMRDLINSDPNVSFDSFWIPNGFYNVSGVPVIAAPEQKQNIILTVGRLGTAQKNNEELLLAFALIADLIPDWKIHLVGSVDERIEPFLSKYFETFPNLKDRVIFKGKIVDKAELYSEYATSKIFALTSKVEGGTPNVYSEALVHGCAFITSNIDAADDITDYGELGVSYTQGSITDLAKELLHMCKNATTDFMAEHIPKALDYARRYYDWTRNAKKIIYAMYH